MDNVIKKIADRFGDDILLDSSKLSSLIGNYTKDKKTINLMNAAIRFNLPTKIYNTKSMEEADRDAKIRGLCNDFAREYAVTEKAAYQAADYFTSAFKFSKSSISVPKPEPKAKEKEKPVQITQTSETAEPVAETPTETVPDSVSADEQSSSLQNQNVKQELTQDSLIEMQMNAAKKSRIPDILTVATGLIILVGIAVAMFILPDNTFSEQENRALQQFPALSSKSGGSFPDRLTSGDFTKDISKYYSDQFPFRDTFVGLKSIVEIGLRKGENNGVILGKNNYLITKDSYNAIDQLTANIDNIAEFANAMNQMKIPVTLAAAGRSIDALSMYLPGSYSKTDSESLWSSFNGLADYAQNIKRLNLLDPLKQLIEREDRGQIYYRTDHHWTTLGAYYAYAEIIKSFQKEDEFEPLPLSAFNIVAVSNDFYGTTWSKAGMKWINPDTIYYFRYDGDEDFVTTIKDNGKSFNGFYDLSYLETKDKYSSFLSGNNSRVDITKPGEPGRPKLLLIKDSFAHSVVPFLAYHYDLIILDLRYYTDSAAKLVFDENISRVLFLHNISNLSEDDIYGMLEYGVEAALRAYVMEQYPIKGIYINNNPIDDYIIVYPVEEHETRQQNYIDAAESLRNSILEKAGVELEIARADELPERDKIIELTPEGIPSGGFMKIATEGNNLIFRCNIGSDPSGYAVKRFTDKYLGKNVSGSFNFGENYIFSDIGDNVIMIMPNRD